MVCQPQNSQAILLTDRTNDISYQLRLGSVQCQNPATLHSRMGGRFQEPFFQQKNLN